MATTWFEGIEEFYKVSQDLTGASRSALPMARLAVQKACADIKADAQLAAPVRNGDLRKSIGYETQQLATSVWGEVGPTVEYGGYVEYGTSRMAPQPYITPAFDKHAPLLEAALEQIADRFAGGR